MFQTLIGTVKSVHLVGAHTAGGGVSNPHRYGQKLARGPGLGRHQQVSNPHRYGQKTVVAARQKLIEKFQTLIGTVKRTSPRTWPSGSRLVSNPHRYGQKSRSRAGSWWSGT